MLLGLALFFPFIFGVGILEQALRAVGLSAPQSPPAFLVPVGAFELALAIVFLLVIAVAEEAIFRGYLLRRFTALIGNRSIAVALAAVIFSLGHGYQGAAGVVAVGVIGIVFALIYFWRESLTAPITMHFLQNFVGIVLAPYAS
jgi:membrane protease YdiL (CAAX protease family)